MTGVGQIRYLNRALKRFDSKVRPFLISICLPDSSPFQAVIPIQFVLFTLSAIIGSAILYGDFNKMHLHQFLTFFYGCAATFLGVFIIAWSPSGVGLHHNGGEVDDDGGAESVNGVEGALVNATTSPGNRTRRVTVVSPGGTPILRRKVSSVSLMGISPAQVSHPNYLGSSVLTMST